MNKELLEQATLIRDSDQYETHFWYWKGFTICTIQDGDNGKIVSVGVSKRNIVDKFNEERGSRIAFVRAVRGMELGWDDDGEEYTVSLWDGEK